MKIYLGSVAWRQIEQAHHSQVIQLFLECAKRGIEIREGSVVGDALVSRSRSLAASSFLRSDCDVLLTIDSDIWFRPQDAIELCEMALAGYDMIGALYMTRALKTQPAMLLPNDQPLLFAAGQKPVETQFLSTGFCAVTRAPFEALAKTLPHCHLTWRQGIQDTSFWPFYMPTTIEWPEDGHLYLSEDWAFCHRAREAGFKLWLHPGIRLGHIGSHTYTLEDLIRPERSPPQPLRLTRQAEGKLTTEAYAQMPREVMELPADVAKFLGIEDPEGLKQQFAMAGKLLGRLYQERNGETDAAFYAREDVGKVYMLDLANWHCQPKVAGAYMSLNTFKNKGLRVLDYGSGIGTSALMLAEGNKVNCVEPNAVMREFTQLRAEAYERQVSFLPASVPLRDYDLAVCFHVLEHVPQPERTAALVANALKPGGYLFAESDFTDDGQHPMHQLNADDPRGEGYWQALGLERLNDYWWRKP